MNKQRRAQEYPAPKFYLHPVNGAGRDELRQQGIRLPAKDYKTAAGAERIGRRLVAEHNQLRLYVMQDGGKEVARIERDAFDRVWTDVTTDGATLL